MPLYADLGDLPEDQRIEAIGKAVMGGSKSSGDKPIMAAFVVEDDEKADRYIKKLQERFPGIRVIDRFKGPVPGTISVRVAEPLR
jgi:hypothetical protein